MRITEKHVGCRVKHLRSNQIGLIVRFDEKQPEDDKVVSIVFNEHGGVYTFSVDGRYILDQPAILSLIDEPSSLEEPQKTSNQESNHPNFQIGDKVYDYLMDEEGVVASILENPEGFDDPYVMEVQFTSEIRMYTKDGRYYDSYKNPTLFHGRPTITAPKPQKPVYETRYQLLLPDGIFSSDFFRDDPEDALLSVLRAKGAILLKDNPIKFRVR